MRAVVIQGGIVVKVIEVKDVGEFKAHAPASYGDVMASDDADVGWTLEEGKLSNPGATSKQLPAEE